MTSFSKAIVRIDYHNVSEAMWPGDEVTKVVLYSEALASPVDDVTSQFRSNFIIAQESFRVHAGEVSDLGIYFLKNATTQGRGFISIDNEILDMPDLLPQFPAKNLMIIKAEICVPEIKVQF